MKGIIFSDKPIELSPTLTFPSLTVLVFVADHNFTAISFVFSSRQLSSMKKSSDKPIVQCLLSTKQQTQLETSW